MTAARCCCRWDFPSYGTIRVLSGAAAGSYIVSKDDRRDGQSAFIRADTDAQLASVFEFYYRTDINVYLLTGVSFKFGPGTDDGWGERMCGSRPAVPGCLEPCGACMRWLGRVHGSAADVPVHETQ